MYDFSKQKAMLEATLLLLEENKLSEVSTLGGGTALASYYQNHRYSTDIDIFIYDKVDKGNSKDLFDIAIAFHKEPNILTKTLLKKDKVSTLFETVSNIYGNQELKNLYLEEIQQMNPNSEYEFLAINTIEYLYNLLKNICGAYDIPHELSSEEYIEIENYVYTSLN